MNDVHKNQNFIASRQAGRQAGGQGGQAGIIRQAQRLSCSSPMVTQRTKNILGSVKRRGHEFAQYMHALQNMHGDIIIYITQHPAPTLRFLDIVLAAMVESDDSCELKKSLENVVRPGGTEKRKRKRKIR
jgi:hypothetical protein